MPPSFRVTKHHDKLGLRHAGQYLAPQSRPGDIRVAVISIKRGPQALKNQIRPLPYIGCQMLIIHITNLGGKMGEGIPAEFIASFKLRVAVR